MDKIDILIPTLNRPHELSLTLLGLYFQTYGRYSIFISSQDKNFSFFKDSRLSAVLNLHKARGRKIFFCRNFPKRGMAEQRNFLLKKAKSPLILFLDDDLILEKDVLERMASAIKKLKCGFVGQAPVGLSFLSDKRPKEQKVFFWRGRIHPEVIMPGSKEWQRYKIHNAANIYHVQEKMKFPKGGQKPYKVAWIGGCVLYDRKKLEASGGFSFWKNLPKDHAGEEAQAQLQVMKKYGGCGLIPSGVYHLESPTTLKKRTVNAPEFLNKKFDGKTEKY